MSTTTATVQTLTAEVRVLQVGSRQVTLSVYKQLDYKPHDDLELFGRVHATKDLPPNDIELVGRDSNGVLVRSWIGKPCWTSNGPAEFDHWLWHTRPAIRGNSFYVFEMGSAAGHSLDWRCYTSERPNCYETVGKRGDLPETSWGRDKSLDATVRWLQAERKHRWARGEFCDLASLKKTWREAEDTELADNAAEEARYAEAKALPLIVLAGLK